MNQSVISIVKAAFGVIGLEVRSKRPLSITNGHEIPPAPELPERLLANCRVLASREHLLAALPKHGTAAEVGVADGDFSESILQINIPNKLVLVDAWGSDRYRGGFDRVNERFAAQIAAGTVQIERGLSIEVMKRLPPRSFDWIYLDTVHDYATTKAELELAAALIVPDGYIAGHDFCIGNPALAIQYGVIPAACEFCIERDFHFTCVTLAADGFLSFCLSAGGAGQLSDNGSSRQGVETPSD